MSPLKQLRRLISLSYRTDLIILPDNPPYTADDPCIYCGYVADTWDHLVPVSRGGKDTVENRVRACHSCNRAKGRIIGPLQFLAYRHTYTDIEIKRLIAIAHRAANGM